MCLWIHGSSVNIVTMLRAGRPMFDSWQGQKRDFSLFYWVKTDSGAHPACYPMGSGGSYPGGEAANSFPFSTMVNNAWSYTFTHPIRLHGVVLTYTLIVFSVVSVPLCRCAFLIMVRDPRKKWNEFWVENVGPCHHGMTRPRIADGGDGLSMWRVSVNILNKQLWTADKRWLPKFWGWAGSSELYKR